MSFAFRWPRFSDKFHVETTEMLTQALNKGNKPPIIQDKIEVTKLEMGTQPPELEIRDIGDLTTDQFRGIFKLSYSGDAYIEIRTKVQANPLHNKKPAMDLLGGSRRILAADQPLVVPMTLRLSNFRLNAYVVLVVSKQKGITLVFKTDPLQNVDVNSTFDSIAVIQKYIQKEIEGQLREMFREDLPAIIHKLSQRWIPGNITRIETPYVHAGKSKGPPVGDLARLPDGKTSGHNRLETMSAPGGGYRGDAMIPRFNPTIRFPLGGTSRPSPVGLFPRPASTVGYARGNGRPLPLSSSMSLSASPQYPPRRALSVAHSPLSNSILPAAFPPSPTIPNDDTESSFPDIENYDPTYGMRPDGIPNKSAYASFRRLWGPSRGLGDLAEESADNLSEDDGIDDDIDYTEGRSYVGGSEWNRQRGFGGMSVIDSTIDEDSPSQEYESVPAIGGGTVLRPRVYRAQSRGGPLSSTPGSRHNSPFATPVVGAGLGLGSSYPRSSAPHILSRANSSYLQSPERRGQSPLRNQWGAQSETDLELGASARTYASSHHSPYSGSTSGAGPSRPRLARALQSDLSLYGLTPGIPLDISHEFVGHSPESSFISRSSSGAVTHPTLSTPPSSELQPRDFDLEDDLHRAGPSGFGSRPRKGSISLSAVHPFHAYTDPLDPSSPEVDGDYDPLTTISHISPSSRRAELRLRPDQDTTAHLATLSYSNHTLSPFTRTGAVEHYAVRSGLGMGTVHGSGPTSGAAVAGAHQPAKESRVPVKARRKRTIHLGGKGKGKAAPPPGLHDRLEADDLDSSSVGGGGIGAESLSPPLSDAEFAYDEEVDHYFSPQSTTGLSLNGFGLPPQSNGDIGDRPSSVKLSQTSSRTPHSPIPLSSSYSNLRRRTSGTRGTAVFQL